MYCPECGSTLDENAVFCGECGTKLSAGAQPPVPPAPAPVPSPSPDPHVPSGTPGAPKKKFPIWLIIVLAVVGVLVIGIVSVFALKSFIGKKQEVPEEATVSAYDESEDVMNDFFGEETDALLSESDTTAENTDQVPTVARTKVMTTQKIIATRAPETKPEVTKAPSTVAPPSTTRPPVTQSPSDTTPTQPADDDWWLDDWWFDDDYYPPVYGYTLDELEDAMDDFIYTGRWSDLSEYILPGSDEILDLMYSIEDSEGYANYAYLGGYEYINEYYYNFDEIPSAYSTDYYYHSLDAEDEEYRDNTMWGLYEMTEYAFDEYYGGNMEYYDLILMETCAYDDDYNDNGFFVFIIETDYGYFFLCE